MIGGYAHMLDFGRLQSQLRQAVSARISSGQINGVTLARKTGFQQAHISNFLRARRGLSVEAMDRMLSAMELSVLDLVPASEINNYSHAGDDREYEGVALVDYASMLVPTPPQKCVHERLKFKRNFLKRLRPEPASARQAWTRFLLVRASEEDADVMYPRILRGAVLLIDRHYNSLRPYRRGDANMYAVQKGDSAVVRYVEMMGKQLTLRPEVNSAPLDFVPIEAGRGYADYILGRVCHVSVET